MKRHYIPEYFLQGVHPITVTLVGVGGNGSNMLSNLAKIHTSLQMLNHPGLMVFSYDIDTVSEHNVGRQVFSQSEIGLNKAVAMTDRINRFYGTAWEGFPHRAEGPTSNILITCTDNIPSRVAVSDMFLNTRSRRETEIPYYWLDVGNKKDIGQVVMGTFKDIKQPKDSNSAYTLPHIADMFQEWKTLTDMDTPSCSAIESLRKQDLFINSIVSQFASNMLWKLFFNTYIEHHGCFINLNTLQVNPIKIK